MGKIQGKCSNKMLLTCGTIIAESPPRHLSALMNCVTPTYPVSQYRCARTSKPSFALLLFTNRENKVNNRRSFRYVLFEAFP